MSFQQTVRQIITVGGEDVTIGPTIYSGGARADLSESIPDGSTNALVAWALDVSQCKGFFLKVNGPCVIKTNSSGSPDNTLTFAAAGGYSWAPGDPAAFALTVDVTKLYITNSSGAAVLVDLRCLYDPTV